jgi:isoquinoline 1-oxidoreductase beta subunit
LRPQSAFSATSSTTRLRRAVSNEAAVDEKGHVTVPRVDTAIDCGFAANPERIRSQIEGAAVMGMALALYGEITFKKGRVEQSNYDSY